MNHKQIFLSHIAQTSDSPLMLEIERAEGIYLYATDGTKYIDLISGIAVSNIGHCHPKVVQAVKNQAEKYMHLLVYGELIQSPQTLLAQKLVENLPSSLDNVYFVNSGTEATEGAMKLVKRYTRRSEIIACHNAYHGSTQGALSMTGGEQFRRAFRPLLPAIRRIGFGITEDLELITPRTAAVFIETIQGEAGVIQTSQDYFQALRKRCDETGALLAFDEIQTGFGRTGKLWAFEHYGVVPDVVLFAKGMGGGMPIGAFVSSHQIMSVLTNHPVLGHITTFGGHPVSCAAALASLEVILEDKWYEQAEEKAELFKKYLVHPHIQQIRHKGLMMAIEFDSFDKLHQVIRRCLTLGVLTDWFLYCDTAMRIAPPLVITPDEIQQACELILKAIECD
jgi:putrescine aminotransferase